jgi:hypothetical protein
MLRPLYSTDSIPLTWDKTLTAIEGFTSTATNFEWLGGSSWSIQIPLSLSAHGGIDIQINNSNPYILAYTNTLMQTIHEQRNASYEGMPVQRNAFTGNWITIDSISNGVAFRSLNDVTGRYIRLSGIGLTAAGMTAYLFTDQCVKGT